MNFDYEIARGRAKLYKNIRSFFDKRGYLEVFTPTLSPFLIPEPTINSFSSSFISEFNGEKEFYLIPSPEVFMKELLSSSSPSIFQISTCFRNNEQLGKTHNPEFTMLEYYTLNFDDKDSIVLTEDFLKETSISKSSIFSSEPLIITMEEAFKKWAALDLNELQEDKALKKAAKIKGYQIDEDESWEVTFNRIFLNEVEPSFPLDKRVYLTDYPKQIECLAEDYEDRPYKKRWEMYISGIEIANCYTEERDKDTIKYRLETEEKILIDERKGGKNVISPYNDLFSTLNMPPSSGVAIGLDRLLMVELELNDINQTLLFPFSELMKR